MIETGPKGTKSYPIEQVLGGKNVFYFLTPLERAGSRPCPLPTMSARRSGSTLPPAACATSREGGRDAAVGWREYPYTFNTACYSCHVSQLSTNYDPKTDTYHTTWTEPGINCETCHGSSEEHNEIARATARTSRSRSSG